MELEFVSILSVIEYNYLRESVNWKPLSERQAQNVFQHSAYLTAVRQDGKIIAMARVLTDYANIYFLADVIVLPSCQGKGLGKKLLTRTMDYIKSCIVPGETVQIDLMAANGKEAFYEKYGFQRNPSEKLGHGMTLWYTKESD